MSDPNNGNKRLCDGCGQSLRFSARVPDLHDAKQVLFFTCEACGSVLTQDVPHEPPKH